MINPADAYALHARRGSQLIAWLQVALERHRTRTAEIADIESHWPMVDELCYMEDELIPLLKFVSGLTKNELAEALGDGGQDDE